MRRLCVLGATGSVGVSTLDVVRRHPEKFSVVALTAWNNIDRLREQCLRYQPELAVVANANQASELQVSLRQAGCRTKVHYGPQALVEAASLDHVDDVMAAIVGGAGLLPTLAAVRAGKRVLLANKEALVMGGALVMAEAARSGSRLIPIDSEHNAIFQCLPPQGQQDPLNSGVRRILLTASGGPFRDRSLQDLKHVTPEEACAHPNWIMGRKISVDSATMMNKGLEVIEACWLFKLRPDDIQVVVHPQSVIHSLVEYVDGSVLAQLGQPDMRTPIAYALAWPERIESGVGRFDIFAYANMEFRPPDFNKYPCLTLALQVAREDQWASIVLNAANEVAVAAFLVRQVGFLDMASIISHALERITPRSVHCLDDILELDKFSRRVAHDEMTRLAS